MDELTTDELVLLLDVLADNVELKARNGREAAEIIRGKIAVLQEGE